MRTLFPIMRIYIQAFTRRTLWMILLAFGFIFTLFCYVYVYGKEPYLALNQTSYGQAMLTLIFMMMGLELKREQQREHLDEMLSVYSKAGMVPLSQVLSLGLLSLLVTLSITTGCYIRMAMDGAPALWIKQSLAYVVLLYFLPCWILGVWGLLIAQWNRSKSVYLPAMLVWLLTSSLCTYITHYTVTMGLGNGGFLFNAFNMGINSFHIPDNLSTGAPIELPRWVVRIGLLAFVIALFLCDNARRYASTRPRKRRAWTGMVSVIACGIAMMVFFYQSFFVFFTRFADREDVRDYVWSKDEGYLPGEPVSLADYPTEKNISLQKTDIVLSCTTQGIRAEVAMEAALNTEANGQAFTLYSDLTVDEIEVDGKKADFERSNDGLMVHFGRTKTASEKTSLVFRYHGYSLPSFPANETTVQLNRSFPWIPWPGIKTSARYSNYYAYSGSEDFFIEDWQRGDKVEYNLHYDGPGNLYTNLENKGDNLYTGVSFDGVSLYSGMVHCRYRETDVYVPASCYRYVQLAADALLDAYDPLLDLCERMDTIRKPEKPRSIVVMQMDCPLLSEFVFQQELYSRHDEWEIRMCNDASSTISSRISQKSLEEYQTSPDVLAGIAIPYLLNPCSGYPFDVSHSSTKLFATWLSVYIHVYVCGDNDLEYYAEALKEECSGKEYEYINGELAPETPLSQEEEGWISVILDRMHNGENFDKVFKALYHRLLKGDAISASEIVSQLYYHQGD